MISVIIPHANSFSSLKTLLSSLENQVCSTPFEVVVICNPPSKYLSFPEVKTSFPLGWEKSLAGANMARQQGIDVSTGEILLFIDDDCEVRDPHFLQKHFDAHKTFPEVAGIGGIYKLQDKNNLWGRVYNILQNQWLQSHRLPNGYTSHILGGNSSYKKHVFESEKLNTKIIFGGTETEFQVRLKNKGFSFRLIDGLEIYHTGCISLDDFIKKSFKQGVGMEYIASLHTRAERFIFFSAPPKLSKSEWFAVEVYNTSFRAGRDFYLKYKKLSLSSFTLYKKFIRQVLKRFDLRTHHAGRELLWLKDMNMSVILSSKHNNDPDSTPNPDGPKN